MATDYILSEEAAQKWEVAERTVRYYCENGRVPGAALNGKTWLIPEDAEKPLRKQRAGSLPTNLLARLKEEKNSSLPGGIYHKIQVELTYNSNHMEGSRLSHEQTRHIFETNTVGIIGETLNVDDIVETANHFRCVDLMIDMANYPISESLIKEFHLLLKTGTTDSRKPWFAVGDYKRFPNEVNGLATTTPNDVPAAMKGLVGQYNRKEPKNLTDLLDFHVAFERIHPFQDGNGRVGRLLLFKECLHLGIVPFIITDDLKEYYYRGLKEWKNEPGFLTDTCLTAQDRFKIEMQGFDINLPESCQIK